MSAFRACSMVQEARNGKQRATVTYHIKNGVLEKIHLPTLLYINISIPLFILPHISRYIFPDF